MALSRVVSEIVNVQKYRDLEITGCAEAQHCYNGDVSFLWEKWKI